MIKLILILAMSAHATFGLAAIKTKTIEYKQGDTVLEGYLAYDTKGAAKKPGVLVVHEWTGLGDYAKRRAEMLAKLGYIAFAPDIYGKGIRPDNPKDASATATIYKSNRALMRARINAGLDQLLAQKNLDSKKIGAIGYCFGGTTVLELARSGAQVSGVVSFHGSLDTPNVSDAKHIKGKVLVLHGADDPYVPMEQLNTFENEMRDAKVDWQLVKYSNAVHSFTNKSAGNDNSAGAAYNATADARSWIAMKSFFEEIFR